MDDQEMTEEQRVEDYARESSWYLATRLVILENEVSSLRLKLLRRNSPQFGEGSDIVGGTSA